MATLVQSITEKAIVAALVRLRLAQARRRHDAHFMRDLVASAPEPGRLAHAVDRLLPPRRQWQRPGRVARRAMASDEQYRVALFNAAMKGLKADAGDPWVAHLKDFISEVKARAAVPAAHPLRMPVIRILPKAGRRKPGEQAEYRVIASYEELADRLILGFVARHLGPLVDPLLSDCACAFRMFEGSSRRSAVKRIGDYLKAHQQEKVYAAECDIKGFFDCVRHDAAREAVRKALGELAGRQVEADPAALAILEQYLDGYDTFAVARPEALKLLDGKKNAVISGPRLKELQNEFPGQPVTKIGIPQGGALSPLLANLVLREVDKAVIGDGSDPDLLYFRYCDDMILLHTSKKQCDAALRRYMDKVHELGFMVHKPAQIRRYGVEFFRAKSKLPYRVAQPAAGKSASPWVNFLGYQIGWDGQLRVRKESLDKHKQKHRELVLKVIRYVTRPRAKLLKTNDAIVSSVTWRLVASGVGKSGLQMTGAKDGHRCWRKAFDLLSDTPCATAQMRRLDQHRDRLVSQVIGALRIFHPGNYDEKRLESVKGPETGLVPKRPLIGRALSYCGSLIGDAPKRLRLRRPSDEGYGRHY